jgi:hypothetical protein
MTPPLVRADVKREEIAAFKRQITRQTPPKSLDPVKRRRQLERRRDTLIARRDQICAELAEIERALGDN